MNKDKFDTTNPPQFDDCRQNSSNSVGYSMNPKKSLKQEIEKELFKIIEKNEISSKYNLVFLYDNQNEISDNMADTIYESIPKNSPKPLLLILSSKGGRIEPAYIIAKACKESASNFVVAIPRKAKSAATLITLGADEIHMGPMSELGPIDPQFGGLPALGLYNSLESLAKIVTKYPASSDMFANFLSQKLDLRIPGYFERVSESAMQYAMRLLKGNYPRSPEEIAKTFVYDYKDHSSVIDITEAKKLLGSVIRDNSQEYRLANEIHQYIRGKNNSLVSVFVNIIGDSKGVSIEEKKDD